MHSLPFERPHFFSNSPGQPYNFLRICREYKCFTFARYSPQCESSMIFATPHERPRMLTNTYEYLSIILRSLRLVANCIRKPIRHIFATIWRICREYIFLHSQGYSPQCETSITYTFQSAYTNEIIQPRRHYCVLAMKSGLRSTVGMAPLLQ